MIITYYKQPERPAKERPTPKQTIFDAPGVEVGQAIEWTVGNKSAGITEREKELICQKTQSKTLTCVRLMRALNVKNLMATNTVAQIARRFEGRKGYGLRTIAAIHAALSQAKGEGR